MLSYTKTPTSCGEFTVYIDRHFLALAAIQARWTHKTIGKVSNLTDFLFRMGGVGRISGAFGFTTVPPVTFIRLPNEHFGFAAAPGAGQMPRPRTPTNILDARGAFKKHPERRRVDPDTKKLRPAPKHLDESKRATWREIVRAAPEGVITEADRFALEIAVQLLCEFRSDPIGYQAARLTILNSLLAKMGMTPCDRAKVARAPQKPKTANPFEVL